MNISPLGTYTIFYEEYGESVASQMASDLKPRGAMRALHGAAIHTGVECDESGQCPIIGTRYKVSLTHRRRVVV